MKRRTFIGATAGALAASGKKQAAAESRAEAAFHRGRAPSPVPLVYCADLYHPPVDPDDHWDWATLAAMKAMGLIDLKAVVLDHPGEGIPGTPALDAIAMLLRLLGKTVPVAVGPREPFDASGAPEGQATRLFREVSAHRPVVVVTGSCRSAAAAWAAGALQMRALYVNAGTVAGHGAPGLRPEYNVALDPAAYRYLLSRADNLYWMPCFHKITREGEVTGVHDTQWSFRQGEALGVISENLQRFFLQWLTDTDTNWLETMAAPVDKARLAQLGGVERRMWCTAGFLHAAGLGVTRSGRLVHGAQIDDPVFGFKPERIRADKEGRVERSKPLAVRGRDAFIFAKDPERYEKAMESALKAVLRWFP